MLKRILLALALVGALGACNTPAATSSPALTSPSAPAVENPSDSGLESMEPVESPSAEPSAS
jgi:hypothetical protein